VKRDLTPELFVEACARARPTHHLLGWHSRDLGEMVADLCARAERAEAEVERLTKLAYLGDHHFPDLTYKARLEELVPQHRALQAEVALLREALAVCGRAGCPAAAHATDEVPADSSTDTRT